MIRVESKQNDLNECDDECSIFESESTTSESFLKCCSCNDVWSHEIRIIVGNEEICENCMDIYKTISGLKNKLIKELKIYIYKSMCNKNGNSKIQRKVNFIKCRN